jgi:hypothetical protein
MTMRGVAMKRTFFAAVMVLLVLSLTGCGHDHNNSPRIISTSILSDPAFDGDIEQVSPTLLSITTIAGGAQSVLAGLSTTTNTEFRAFLDFPLTSVPLNAGIDSAFLDIIINNVTLQSGNTIPIRIDLIDIQSAALTVSDYDLISRPPLASITLNIFLSDIGHSVNVDVTSLMTVAQNRGLTDFRIRILEDLGPVIPGIIEINDATATTAPLLQVNYF